MPRTSTVVVLTYKIADFDHSFLDDAGRKACRSADLRVQVPLDCNVPRIIKGELDASGNLTEREPKSAVIASQASDNCKPLRLGALADQATLELRQRAEQINDQSALRGRRVEGYSLHLTITW